MAYAADPRGNRLGLIQTLGGRVEELPAPMLLALTDAYLRGERWTLAARAAQEAIARNPGEPWLSWARLGSGWAAAGRREYDVARRDFLAVAEASPQLGPMARVATALLDATRGELAEARAGFRAVADDGAATGDVRDAAAIGLGMVALRSGDAQEAGRAFGRVTARAPGARLADEAAYGAARARWLTGDDVGAEHDLEALAGARLDPVHVANPKLVALEPTAVLRTGMRRYERAPASTPDTMLVAALDWDGRELARSALRRLHATSDSDPIASRRISARHLPVPGALQPESGNVGQGTSTALAGGGAGARWRWLPLLLVVAATATVLILRRRREGD